MKPSAARALVALAGRSFVPLGLLAKLPLAMGQLGVLLLVADRTGSFTTGGLAAAAIGLGSAVGAPIGGALADRLGQRVVLVFGGLTYAVAVVVVLLLAHSSVSAPLLLAAAAVAGLFAPQVGPLARVRWVALIARRQPQTARSQRLSEAFALEGATDEASFVAGPALVGVAAAVADPWLGLAVTAALSATAVVAFGLHGSAAAVRDHRAATRAQPPMNPAAPATRRGLPGGATTVGLLGAGMLLGLVFGGTQVGVTSMTAAAGHPGAAGPVYALLALGSALAGLASAGLPARFRPADRLLAFAAGLALLALPLLVVGNLTSLSVTMAVLGCAVAPYLIVLYGLAERATPVERAATVMTMLSSAVIVGYAVGSSTAGALADGSGHQAAFAVPVAAGFAALLLATLCRGRFSRLPA